LFRNHEDMQVVLSSEQSGIDSHIMTYPMMIDSYNEYNITEVSVRMLLCMEIWCIPVVVCTRYLFKIGRR